MLAFLLLLSFTTLTSANVVVYERGWIDKDPKVTQETWFWVEKGRHGGDYVVEVDSYQTRTSTETDLSTADTSRLMQWAVQQLTNIAEEGKNGKPLYLDVSVVEKRTTTTGPSVKSSSSELVLANRKAENKRNEFRHSLLLVLLFISCVASWILFFVQAHKLAKRIRKRQQKRLRKKAQKGELKLPLLQPEGAVK